MMSVINLVAFIALLSVLHVQCARILGVFNVASVSHQIVFQPIWRELSLRGHNVTIMSPNPLNDPSLVNLTEIDLSFLYRQFDELKPQMSRSMDHWDMMNMVVTFTEMNTESLFQHNEVMALINDNNTKFDVVLVEAIVPTIFAFAAKFKCPFIGIASLSTPNPNHEAAGNPNHPILYPDMTTSFTEHMTFLEKVEAVLFDIYQRYQYHYTLYPAMNRVVKKYFGQDMPDLLELTKNMSMLFLNSNPILHNPRPYGPNVIELGRMHLKPKRPLPEDIKQFLDNSTKGVIYFSLGSNVKSMFLDESKKQTMNEVFSELPYNVLWKFEDEKLDGKPPNVEIRKWLPQQDLLSHPNIKLFITQGGLQSLEEAISDGVPLLAMPFFADQFKNAAQIEKIGIGLQLHYHTLNKHNFKNSILQVIENARYKAKVKEIQRLLQDEPTTGLERAVWWTEYVIRNKGAPHFRNRSVDMPWHEFLLLDVYAFLLAIVLVGLYIVFKAGQTFLRMFRYYRFSKAKSKTL